LAFGSFTGQVQSIQGVDLGGSSSRSIAINALGGNVGIGTAAPSQNLHVAGNTLFATSSGSIESGFTSGGSNAYALLFAQSTSGTLYMGVNGTAAGSAVDVTGILDNASYFGSRTNHATQFLTNNTVRATIDSSGNLLVGKTSSTNATVGAELRPAGDNFFTRNSGPTLTLRRNTSDGSILDFEKDGTTVGVIASSGDSGIIVGTTDVGLRFRNQSAGAAIFPRELDDTALDNAVDLGTSGSRFKDLYLSGSVYLGGTGSANALDDYEEGTWTPSVGGTATYNAGNYGRYVKVGNIVSLQFCINIALIGTGSATSVTNLPFTSENIGNVQTGCVSYFANLNTSTNFIAFYVDNNATSITFVGNTGNTATVSLNGFSIFQNGTEVFGAVTYRTA
jgi:hypothetical protein